MRMLRTPVCLAIPYIFIITGFIIESHIKPTPYAICSASCAAEDLKRRKYSQLVANFEFVPVAVETSGIIGSAGYSLLTDIGRRISRASNDLRQTSYIFHQISVAIIRGNALSTSSSVQTTVLLNWLPLRFS